MRFSRTAMRYAHTDGYTHCCYSENGKVIITCGSDGDIRSWNGIDDDDPSSQCVGEFTYCVYQYDDRLLVGTDVNTVQAYTYPGGDRDGIELRFTLAVTTIKVDQKFIAAGAESHELKCVPLDKSENYFELVGHEAIVLKIDTSVRGLLASSSGDGTIRIWDLTEKKEIHRIDGLPKAKTFSSAKLFNTPCFEPKAGKLLAYPKDKSIIILSTDDWSIKETLTDSSNSSAEFTTCCFSPCGRFMAAGTLAGEMSIWSIANRRSITGEAKGDDTQAITSIAWNPSENGEIAFCDASGQLCTLINCNISETHSSAAELLSNDSNEVDLDFGEIPDNLGDTANGDAESEDGENCFSLEKIKNKILGNTREEDILADLKSSRPASRMSDHQPVVKEFHVQHPFQPGSTPCHLEQRFLVWNNIGVVKADKNGEDGSIYVDLHDVSNSPSLHFSNHMNHSMASLSKTCVALSGETSCKLVCIVFNQTGNREWTVEMPNCEEVLAVGASDKLVAVATDTRYLRIFSTMGTQREVISIPGPVVCLAGHNDSLLVAYHSSPATADQHISMMIIQSTGLQLRCREVKIPLSPASKLTWLGFSDKGSPVCSDSLGIVRLYKFKSNLWFPICETLHHGKGASDTFFIIEVMEQSQVVNAVLCRGVNYPLTYPRPIITPLPIQMPVCQDSIERSCLEEILVRCAHFTFDKSDMMLKETALKLFAIACRTEQEIRARELIEIIGSTQILPLAIKYARGLGRMHLAEKLGDLMPKFEMQAEENEKKEKEFEEIQMTNSNGDLYSNRLLVSRGRSKSPSIIPKPIELTTLKRNPFKKNLTPHRTSGIGANPLSHLTERAVGHAVSESVGSIGELNTRENSNQHSQDLFDSSATELLSPATETPQSSPGNFLAWFEQNRQDLQKENPDVTVAELTKLGMRKFKALSQITTPAAANGKRKLEETAKAGNSGLSKLAKFSYNK